MFQNQYQYNNNYEGIKDTEHEEDVLEKHIKKKPKGFTRFNITIEPIKFFVGFTISFTDGIRIDLLERNICFTHYNLSLADYQSLNESSEIKEDVEAITAQVNMIIKVLQSIVPLILVIFIGPWSDKNGRKPFLMWAQLGYLLYYLMWGVFSFFPYLPVAYFFIPSIPLGLGGNIGAIYVCSWSYLCDIFEADRRTMRFIVSGTAFLFGGLLGNSLAQKTFLLGGDYGFQLVYLISSFSTLISLLYTIFGLQESVVCGDKKGRLLDLKHIRSLIELVLIRPKKGRIMITFVLMILLTEIGTCIGEEALAYIIGKSKYNWTLGQYNLFSALSALASAIFPLIMVWFLMDILGWKNPSVLILSASLVLILQALKAASMNEEMYWSTSILLKMIMVVGSCADSELCDSVSEENVGKAFTITSLIDSLSPIVAIPIYTEIYMALLPDRVLYTYFFSFGMCFITVIGAIGILIMNTRTDYNLSSEEYRRKECQDHPETEKPLF